MVDIDGKINYSNITTVKMYNKDGGINVFPNPVADELNIEIPSTQNELANIKITDASGKIFLQKDIQLNTSLVFTSVNTKMLPAGMYLLVVSRDNKQEVKKIIKK